MEFTEDQRKCFGPYPGPDGTPRWADPLLTHRHLTALFEGDVGRVVRELRSDTPGLRHQATALAAWAACEAFGLPAFDPETGQGTPAAAALALLRDFLFFVSPSSKPGGTTSASPCGASPGSSPSPSLTPPTAA